MAAKCLLAAVFASAFVSAELKPQSGRNKTIHIIGGVPARKDDFPFVVSMQLPFDGHICTGALIDEWTVLTAAHCVYGVTHKPGLSASDVTIRAGSLKASSGGVTAGVLSMHTHSDWDHKTLDNDIAVLKLSRSLPEDDTIRYATLASEGSDPDAGTVITAAGWGYFEEDGYDSSEVLNKVNIPVISRKKCRSYYRSAGFPRVTENMFCLSYIGNGEIMNDKDTCKGDSGGPLIHPKTGDVVGLVSWGGAIRCGEDGYPGVNARVGSLRAFIDEYLD